MRSTDTRLGRPLRAALLIALLFQGARPDAALAQGQGPRFVTWEHPPVQEGVVQVGLTTKAKRTRSLEGAILGGVLFAALGVWAGDRLCQNSAAEDCTAGTVAFGALGCALGALIGYGFGREIERQND